MKLSLLIAMSGSLALANVAKAQEAPRELNWNTYVKVRDYADRKAGDKHYLSIPWKDTVLDGMIQGQKEDKPVLLWLYFGDGRGHCWQNGVKTRQLVWNNKENAEFAAKHFACVSTSDVAYRFLPEADKQKNEFKLLKKAMTAAPNGIHQGIYVVTPRGKLIGKVDEGWPTYDTAAALRNMKAVLATYQGMEKSQRLAPRLLTEKDRSYHRKGYGTAPEGTIKLMSVTRGLPFNDMQLFDLRHKDYFKIDRIWYTEAELKSLIPANPTKGLVTTPNREVVVRIARYAHFMVGGLPWNNESFKDLKLQSKVVAVKEGKVYLTLEGDLDLESDTRWNNTEYAGKLLGRIIYDSTQEKFIKFELVGLGSHELNGLASNVHRGNTTKTQVAMVIKLNEQGSSETEITPQNIQEYPRHLKPKAYRDIKW